ncbi:MAG TPA: hypothetical protein VN786_07745, partial [Acidimicrobiales bacterium]|nr:hypothetical protein [Acidimicrobiales bacterium]
TLPSATTLPATTLPPTTTTLPSATTLPPTTAAILAVAGPRGPSGLGPQRAPSPRLTPAPPRNVAMWATAMWVLIAALLVVVLAGSLAWGARAALGARRRAYRLSKRNYPLLEATT